MAELATSYMGLRLKSPVIAGSCTHTLKPETVRRLAAAGVGAVVAKSIFEEQIRADARTTLDALEQDTHPEALEYLRADLSMRQGPEQYIERLRAVRAATDIPVIASVNCVTEAQWVPFAAQIQAAGADALEMNIYDVATDPAVPGSEIEERHLRIVRAVCSRVRLPVAVKLAPFYSSLAHFAARVREAGAKALVLFNRFLQPDIEPDTARMNLRVNLSRPADLLLPLRWVAVLRSQLEDVDLSLTTGVHGAEDAAKAILAGATTVQVCSVLYERGIEEPVRAIVQGLGAWMDRHGYASLADCRGLALRHGDSGARGFERAQYVRALSGLE